MFQFPQEGNDAHLHATLRGVGGDGLIHSVAAQVRAKDGFFEARVCGYAFDLPLGIAPGWVGNACVGERPAPEITFRLHEDSNRDGAYSVVDRVIPPGEVADLAVRVTRPDMPGREWYATVSGDGWVVSSFDLLSTPGTIRFDVLGLSDPYQLVYDLAPADPNDGSWDLEWTPAGIGTSRFFVNPPIGVLVDRSKAVMFTDLAVVADTPAEAAAFAANSGLRVTDAATGDELAVHSEPSVLLGCSQAPSPPSVYERTVCRYRYRTVIDSTVFDASGDDTLVVVVQARPDPGLVHQFDYVAADRSARNDPPRGIEPAVVRRGRILQGPAFRYTKPLVANDDTELALRDPEQPGGGLGDGYEYMGSFYPVGNDLNYTHHVTIDFATLGGGEPRQWSTYLPWGRIECNPDTYRCDFYKHASWDPNTNGGTVTATYRITSTDNPQATSNWATITFYLTG